MFRCRFGGETGLFSGGTGFFVFLYFCKMFIVSLLVFKECKKTEWVCRNRIRLWGMMSIIL